jgi:hypothetical protein
LITVNGKQIEERFTLPDGRAALSCAVYTSEPAAVQAFGGDVQLVPLDTPRDGCSFAWVEASAPAKTGDDGRAPRLDDTARTGEG